MILFIEFFCLLGAGFFAGLETGLLSADKLHIFSRKEKGILWARMTDFLLSRPERLLGTTLIGTNISVVTASIVLAGYLRDRCGGIIVTLGSIGLSVVFLLLSEIIPKTFFKRYANTVTVRLAVVMVGFYVLFLPISFILNRIIGFFFLLTGRNHHDKMPQSKEDFRLLMHLSSRESGLGYDDSRIIDDIIDFGASTAREAMIPFHRYPVCHKNQNPGRIISLARQTGFRFIPVFERRTDDIIGCLDVRSLAGNADEPVVSLLQEPVYYPETKPLPDLLDEMIAKELEVVFLTDEYGAIAGVITPMEIASRLIGFIPGKEHTHKDEIRKDGPGIFIAGGATDLEFFSHETGIPIEKGSTETLGGYLCEKLGRIPPAGTVYSENKVAYTVLESDRRWIIRIRIEYIPE